MRLLRRWFRRTGNFLTRRQDDERVQEEIAEHIAMQTAENMRAGMTAEEAKRNALLKFGAVEAMKEDYRGERGLLFLETLLQDIHFAFRMLRKSPGFTAVAILTLALGIGVNTAIFSAFDALVLRPFPVMQPDRLVDIYRSAPGEPEGRFSYPDYIYYRDHARSLSDLALFGFGSVVTSSDLPATGPGASPAIARAIGFHLPQLLQGSARPITCFFVSGNYFSLLGARPFQGRILLPSDDLAAAQPVVMMSGNFWRHEFRSDPSVIGSTLHLNGQNFTVVGITPVDYVGTEPEVPDLWAPITARLHVDNLSAADLQES